MSFNAAIKLGLTALVLGMVAWKIDFSSAARVLASLAWTSVLIAILLVVVQAASAAMRLTKIVEIVGARLPTVSSFRVTLESMFFAQTFVSVLGGDVLRIWRIRSTGVRLQDA